MLVLGLGYDTLCSASGLTAYECAWFTWEDQWDTVNWAAVDGDGNRGLVRWVAGHDASGDLGWKVECSGPWCWTTYKKVFAYISQDRTQVRAKFLNQDGSEASDFLIESMPSGSTAWQTAVAYSPAELRWLLVWSEKPPTTTVSHRLRNRYVTFDGVVSSVNEVGYCEAGQQSCGPYVPTVLDGGVDSGGVDGGLGRLDARSKPDAAKDPKRAQPPKKKATPAQQNAWLISSGCPCKGYWLASSQYGSSNDRYRLHEYLHSYALTATGTVSGTNDVGNPWRPVTQFYGGPSKPFAQLRTFDTNAAREEIFDLGSAGPPTAGSSLFTIYGAAPQAFHDEGFGVAAALSTGSKPFNQLALSLSASSASGIGACP